MNVWPADDSTKWWVVCGLPGHRRGLLAPGFSERRGPVGPAAMSLSWALTRELGVSQGKRVWKGGANGKCKDPKSWESRMGLRDLGWVWLRSSFLSQGVLRGRLGRGPPVLRSALGTCLPGTAWRGDVAPVRRWREWEASLDRRETQEDRLGCIGGYGGGGEGRSGWRLLASGLWLRGRWCQNWATRGGVCVEAEEDRVRLSLDLGQLLI